jgi:hypothetical protein
MKPLFKLSNPNGILQKPLFFFNNKSYVIKKNSFWSLDHHIYQSGVFKGRIIHSWSGHYSISICKYKKEINRYTMSVEKPKGWFKSDTMYSIIDKEGEVILSIHYAYEKWKGVYTAELDDSDNLHYEILVYAYLIIQWKQQAASAGAAMPMGVY